MERTATGPRTEASQSQSQSILAELSFVETIDLIYKFSAALLDGLAAAISYPFLGKRAAKRYRTHITHAVLRKLCSRLTIRQTQLGSTTAAYQAYARSRGAVAHTVTVNATSGLHGHWVGCREASKVLVWFHGGGYYAPASAAHFQFLRNMVDAVCSRYATTTTAQSANQDGNGLAAFIPSYTLSPHARYPAQLRQGLETVQYLVETENKSLENIILGGDSAGGNLIMGILSHMAHPHPDPVLPILPEGSLRGALLLSPWVSNDRSWASVGRNKYKDSVTLVSTDLSEKFFLPHGEDWDVYNEPLRAQGEWWADLRARNVLLVSGEDELMTDAHCAFGEILQKVNPGKIEIFTAAGEGHAAPILDLMLGDYSEFQSARRIREWLLSSL